MKLQNAYATVSDPDKRRVYDVRWVGIREKLRAQKESDRRQAEAAETEKKRAAEESAKRQKEDDARQEHIRLLRISKSRYDNDIFETRRIVRRLAAELKRLQDQDDEDSRKEKERNGWWAYLASPIYGRVNETDEQKQARESERLHRIASRRIKGSELREKEAKLQRQQDALQDVNSKIAAEKKRVEDEASAQTRENKLRMEQEARDRELRARKEMAERLAKIQKEQAERAATAAREAQAARRAREAQEARDTQKAREAREARETRETQERIRAAERSRREVQEAARRASASTQSTCRHDRFWPKLEGRHLCESCDTFQRRFAYQCPGCRMIACASCRQTLRGAPRKSSNSGQRFADFSFYDEYEYNG
jgi:hypothetical protein